MARLHELAEIIRGVSFDKTEASYLPGLDRLPVLRAGNIQDALLIDQDLVFVPLNRVSENQRLRPGDIAICMSSGSSEIVGKTAVLERPWAGSVGAFCAIIRPCEEATAPGYVAAWLKSPWFRAWTRRSEGINIKNIRRSELEQLDVPLPHLTEQRRIVDILDRTVSIRRLRRQARETVQLVIPALFSKMFGDPAISPMQWPMVPFGNLLEACDYGTSEKASEDGNGVPVIRMGNVSIDGFLDLNVLKYLPGSASDNHRYLLRNGDLLFNRTNSKELVGKMGLWDASFDAVAASYFIRIRVNAGNILSELVWAFFNTPYMKRRLFETARGAIGQANINSKELKSFAVPVPPMALQHAFVTKVASVMRIRKQHSIAGETEGRIAAAIQAGAFQA
jgi:type I restriction enzyme S subunit